MNPWVIFLTGLSIGGLTCLAVQGGLLASTIANREEEEIEEGGSHKHNLWPVAAFLSTKLIVYTILGFVLGAFGGALSITTSTQIIMQAVAGIYMVAIALNLLNIHPIFRYVVIQPPRFLTRMVRNQSKSKDLFAPALLGAMTIFIPCGTTLAMEALAVSTANPFLGALTMAVFTLGTMPLFFALGFLTTTLGDAFRGKFLKFAAIAVLYLGLKSINGALIAGGAPLSLQSIVDAIPIEIEIGAGGTQAAAANSQIKTIGGVQTADIQVFPTGYNPNNISVKAGIPVKLNLTSTGRLGCTSVFRIPQFGISKSLVQDATETVEFTPKNPGQITWTCSMGMYRGVIEVI